MVVIFFENIQLFSLISSRFNVGGSKKKQMAKHPTLHLLVLNSTRILIILSQNQINSNLLNSKFR